MKFLRDTYNYESSNVKGLTKQEEAIVRTRFDLISQIKNSVQEILTYRKIEYLIEGGSAEEWYSFNKDESNRIPMDLYHRVYVRNSVGVLPLIPLPRKLKIFDMVYNDNGRLDIDIYRTGVFDISNEVLKSLQNIPLSENFQINYIKERPLCVLDSPFLDVTLNHKTHWV